MAFFDQKLRTLYILVMELPTDILPVHMQKSRQAKMDVASVCYRR